jgi:hypothetical protein
LLLHQFGPHGFTPFISHAAAHEDGARLLESEDQTVAIPFIGAWPFRPHLSHQDETLFVDGQQLTRGVGSH